LNPPPFIKAIAAIPAKSLRIQDFECAAGLHYVYSMDPEMQAGTANAGFGPFLERAKTWK
jgi:hypothetical protein